MVLFKHILSDLCKEKTYFGDCKNKCPFSVVLLITNRRNEYLLNKNTQLYMETTEYFLTNG